jgi:hypothetical protein
MPCMAKSSTAFFASWRRYCGSRSSMSAGSLPVSSSTSRFCAFCWVQLKTPYSDGTMHVIFEPLDFMSHIPVLHPSGDPCRANWLSCQFVIAKLAALVPKPRVNLTRFHGVFAPNSKHRVDVTPAKRGKGRARKKNEDKTPEQRHQAMTWAQRLKRVFNIDVSICPQCGGEAKVIASIEDQAVINKILNHLQAKGGLSPPPELLPDSRASPSSDWFA